MLFSITRRFGLLGLAAPSLIFAQDLTTYSITISGQLQTFVLPSPVVEGTTVTVTQAAVTVTQASIETQIYTVTGPADSVSDVPENLPSGVGVAAQSGPAGPILPISINGFQTDLQLPATASIPTGPVSIPDLAVVAAPVPTPPESASVSLVSQEGAPNAVVAIPPTPLSSVLETAAAVAPSEASSVTDAAASDVTSATEAVAAATDSAASEVSSATDSVASAVASATESAASSASDAITSATESIASATESAASDISSATESAASEVSSATESVATEASSVTESAASEVSSATSTTEPLASDITTDTATLTTSGMGMVTSTTSASTTESETTSESQPSASSTEAPNNGAERKRIVGLAWVCVVGVVGLLVW